MPILSDLVSAGRVHGAPCQVISSFLEGKSRTASIEFIPDNLIHVSALFKEVKKALLSMRSNKDAGA